MCHSQPQHGASRAPRPAWLRVYYPSLSLAQPRLTHASPPCTVQARRAPQRPRRGPPRGASVRSSCAICRGCCSSRVVTRPCGALWSVCCVLLATVILLCALSTIKKEKKRKRQLLSLVRHLWRSSDQSLHTKHDRFVRPLSFIDFDSDACCVSPGAAPRPADMTDARGTHPYTFPSASPTAHSHAQRLSAPHRACTARSARSRGPHTNAKVRKGKNPIEEA